MNQFDATLALHISQQTARTHAQIDVDAEGLGKIIDRWYAEVVKLLPNNRHLFARIDDVGQHFSRQIFRQLIDNLERQGIATHQEQSSLIRRELSDRAKNWLLGRASQEMLGLAQVGTPPGLPASRLPVIRLDRPFVSSVAIVGLSSEAKDKLLQQVLFKPMTRARVREILNQHQITGQLSSVTARLPSHSLVSIISRANSQGLSRVEIARQELLPLFHGSKVAAIRVARDTGSVIRHGASMQAFQGLGGLLLGYQCNCVTDKNSRTWHQKRKKKIFWIEPKAGQKGLSAMPNPPFEPDDPAERPAGASKLAFNCRCYLTPVTKNILSLAA